MSARGAMCSLTSTLEHGRALVFEDALDVHLLTHHVVQTLDLTLSRL